jgi:hypothetical protein
MASGDGARVWDDWDNKAIIRSEIAVISTDAEQLQKLQPAPANRRRRASREEERQTTNILIALCRGINSEIMNFK